MHGKCAVHPILATRSHPVASSTQIETNLVPVRLARALHGKAPDTSGTRRMKHLGLAACQTSILQAQAGKLHVESVCSGRSTSARRRSLPQGHSMRTKRWQWLSQSRVSPDMRAVGMERDPRPESNAWLLSQKQFSHDVTCAQAVRRHVVERGMHTHQFVTPPRGQAVFSGFSPPHKEEGSARESGDVHCVRWPC